ncbi:MAG: DUF3618 domain-containing protein [Mycobacteriales bacterium]
MSDSIEQTRAEIAATRAELAETTAALAAKADVKGRVTRKAQQEKAVLGAVAGVTAVLVAVLLWRRRS